MSIPASVTVDSPQAAQELSLVSRPTSRVWSRLRSHPSALVGFGILAVYVLATVFGPLVLRGFSRSLQPSLARPQEHKGLQRSQSPYAALWPFFSSVSLSV